MLLISETPDIAWLQDVLKTLGILTIRAAEQVGQCKTLAHYRLIVVDTTSVAEPVQCITYLHQEAPAAKIVVATASPDWSYARSAFRAGAVEYLSPVMSPRALREALMALLTPRKEAT